MSAPVDAGAPGRRAGDDPASRALPADPDQPIAARIPPISNWMIRKAPELIAQICHG
jgi:hypothetical protein